MGKTIDYELVLSEAAGLPMVKINREKFLRAVLKNHFPQHMIDQAVEHNPAYAGISADQIKKIAKESINYEAAKVTAISFAAGLPGGLAMIGTIPADLIQYLAHILRILQKLAYLYGWEDFYLGESMDDETASLLTLFVGVMFGVNGAAQAINKIAAAAAQRAEKVIAQKALMKGTIYPIVKKTAQILGIRMTKEIFAKGVSKIIPVVGGFASGTLTLFTYKPMAKKLRKYLAELPCADASYYKSGPDDGELIDVEFDEEFVASTLGELDSELRSEEKELAELEKQYSQNCRQ